MSQLTGITPIKTLGQCIGENIAAWLAKPIDKRPPVRDAYERPLNTGRRSNSFTGVPGIARRHRMFTVTVFEERTRLYLGSYVNLRTALQVLADHKGCRPYDLPGVSLNMWTMLKAREKYEPRRNARSLQPCND
ncbi:MAG: hypothetical protein [Caudoviricetes sp.]|nr:MAG: hypothetical protein [Caudoviricetes sp.]